MTSAFDNRRRQLRLLATGDHDCPYLDDRVARTAFVDPRLPLETRHYRQLIAQGFRRSGRYLYRPVCPSCSACQTLRIPVSKFQPHRRHRRCRRRNAEVEVRRRGPEFREEHYDLYARYVSTRHAGGSMADPSPDAYRSFLSADWCDTEFLELREHGRLLGVAVVDELAGALSAVYTFYDPQLESRSLGMLAILLEIEEAVRRGHDWLYLGYWIAGCERMDYKAEYRPHEILTPQGWRRRN